MLSAIGASSCIYTRNSEPNTNTGQYWPISFEFTPLQFPITNFSCYREAKDDYTLYIPSLLKKNTFLARDPLPKYKYR